jgi:hypothetical protein
MMREYHVRICEGLGVQLPGSTRQRRTPCRLMYDTKTYASLPPWQALCHLTMASTARLPTLHELRRFPEEGAIMSYGPDLYDLFRRAAIYVYRILRAPSPPICLWNSLFSDLRREVGGQSVSSSR